MTHHRTRESHELPSIIGSSQGSAQVMIPSTVMSFSSSNPQKSPHISLASAFHPVHPDMVLYKATRGPSSTAVNSSTSSTAATTNACQWHATSPYSQSSEIRRLFNCSHDIFMELHTTLQSSSIEDVQPAVLCASSKYRMALRRCIYHLEQQLDAPHPHPHPHGNHRPNHGQAHDAEEESSFVELLKVILALWHLSEILLFSRNNKPEENSTTTTTLGIDLCNWIFEHYAIQDEISNMELMVSELLKQHARASEDARYWTMIYFFVTTGHLNQASQLLSVYRGSPLEQVESIQHCLRTFPAADTFTNTSIPPSSSSSSSYYHHHHHHHHRHDEWKQWRQMCQDTQESLQDDDDDDTNEKLMSILSILCGNESSLVRHTSSWYQLLASKLLFQQPFLDEAGTHVETLMARCFQEKAANDDNENTTPSPFDCMVMAMMKVDCVNVLRDLSTFHFPWATCHLSDLMTLAGVLRQDVLLSDAHECNLREYFLLNYISSQSQAELNWQLGQNYAKFCPRFGVLTAATLLSHEIPDSDWKTQKLIYIATRDLSNHGEGLVQTLQHVRAMAWKRHGCYGNTFSWLRRAQDSASASSRLCQDLLAQYLDGHRDVAALDAIVQNYDLVRNNENNQQPPEMFQFLRHYRELLLILDDLHVLETSPSSEKSKSTQVLRVQKYALESFVAIFANYRNVPMGFWNDLCARLVPFLEPVEKAHAKSLFSTKGLVMFMEAFHYIEQQPNLMLENVQSIRYLLIQNFTQTITTL